MPFLFARSSLINYSMPALIAVISSWPRALRGVLIGSSARIRAGRGDNRNTRSPRRIASSTLTQPIFSTQSKEKTMSTLQTGGLPRIGLGSAMVHALANPATSQSSGRASSSTFR